MSFLLLGATLALAAYLLAAVACSAAVALCLPALEPRLFRLEPGPRSWSWLALALLPSACATLLSVAVVVPAWLSREPRATGESSGGVLAALAVLGVALIALRLGAGVRLLRGTARAETEWTRRGVAVRSLPLPATRFEHELPVAALVGLFRPRLLLANRLVEALTPGELEAVAAHELGHLSRRDNLRRLLLAASPDPLAWTPAGARLRRLFDEASEAAADLRACAVVAPLRLARALLKAAALAPAGGRLGLPFAAFNGDAPLAARVRALVGLVGAPRPARGTRALASVLGAASFAGVLGLVALSALRPEAHRMLEAAVRLLP